MLPDQIRRMCTSEQKLLRGRGRLYAVVALLLTVFPAAVGWAQSADFSVSAAAPTLSVVAGQSGSMKITLTPSGFHGSVTFSCTGLPTAAPCTFSPNPLAVASTSVFTMMTVAPAPRAPGQPGPYGFNSAQAQLPGQFPGQLPGTAWGALLAAALLPLGMGGIFLSRKRLGKAGVLALSFVLLPLTIAIAGCGYARPKATTFPATITATSGSISHSVQVMVTIN